MRVTGLLAGLLAVASSASAAVDITLVALRTKATIHSVSILADYTGDDNQNAAGWLEVRAPGEAAFRRAHGLVRLSGHRLAGSLLALDADSVYEVRVVVEDPDNTEPATLSVPVRTRFDAPQPVPAGRQWYVEAGVGSDGNPGSAAAPFSTVQKGVSVAFPGDVVHVRPGIYRESVSVPRGGTFDDPIWLVATAGGVVLDGSHAGIAAGAPWTHAGNNLYWTPFTGTTTYVAVDDDRLYAYSSLADLQAENGNIGQPGVIQGGFFADAAAQRLYVITPDHTDPAGHAVHAAVRTTALSLGSASHVLVEGFEVRYYSSYAIDLAGSDCWIRGNRIHHSSSGIRSRAVTGEDNVIEGNSFRDTSVYGWPWNSVKPYVVNGKAITLSSGAGNVARFNRVEGSFNGIYVGSWDYREDEDIAPDTDVHENELRYHGDDGLEVEGGSRNCRYWGNSIRDAYNSISTSPVTKGPAYVVRNLAWGYSQHAVKHNNTGPGWVFFYHNTALPLPLAQAPRAQALEPDLFGHTTSRNNIWEANRYAIEYIPTTTQSGVSLDFDALYSHDLGLGAPCGGTVPGVRFVKWLNVCYPDLPALQASNTIEQHGFQVLPQYEDPESGDFTLVSGHPLLDVAEPIDGINDGTTAGAGPDLGAVERGYARAGADLVPSALAGPRLAAAGALVTLTETTLNRGSESSLSSLTGVYFSTDPVFDPLDQELGHRTVPALDPGQPDTVTYAVALPVPLVAGTYYLIARADSDNGVVERSEGNNSLCQAIGVGPDLVVSALTVPATAGAGLPILVGDTTMNRGAEPAAASATRFYLSTDLILDAADLVLGDRSIPPLGPGIDSSGSTSFDLPGGLASGTYHVLASADADQAVGELAEANNVRASGAVVVGSDLVVPVLGVPVIGGAGYPITVTDTTTNQGAGPAAPATTGLYLSVNTTLDGSDLALGGRSVSQLPPGQSSSGSATVGIPAGTATGTYYLIAKADSGDAVSETVESNNTRSGLIRIGPDLLVSALSVPATAGAGTTITATDSTGNPGGGAAAASQTRFFLSNNTVLDAGDPLLGERGVSGIAPGQSSSASTTLTIPASIADGTYYVIALADGGSVVPETVETNNARSSAAIRIGPDLVVSALTAPPAASAGGSVVVSDTTTNLGPGACAPSLTRFYLSSNTLLDAGDIVLGDRSVPALAAGASSIVPTTLVLPTGIAGTYYVVGKTDADGTVTEILETNNTRSSAAILVGPDLVVSLLTGPAAGGAGAPMSLNDTTTNPGAGASEPSSTRFYLSANTVLDGADVTLGQRPVPALGPSQSSAVGTTVEIPAGTVSGTYYVIAKADADGTVPEAVETNNTRVSAAIRIGPDLLVSALTVPAIGGAGGSIAVNDTTANSGAGAAAPSVTRFYLSVNTALEVGDVSLGQRPVPALGAAQSSAVTTTVEVPAGTATGTYYVIGKADADGTVPETLETNNTRVSGAIRIGPDLVVSALSVPAVGGAGGSISVNDSTGNTGGGSSGASVTRFFLSSNTALDAGDAPLGQRSVPVLAPGQSNAIATTVAIPAGTATGTYYVLAQADADGSVLEVLETNNTRASAAIRVGPDLTVSALTLPAVGAAGGSVNVNNTAANPGGGVSGASVTRFFFSTNGVLDAGDPVLGQRSVPALGPVQSNAATTTLVIPAGTTTGSYYVIAQADADGAVVETLETNNTRVSSVIRIGPDLIVYTVSAPASAPAGSTVTVTETTKNQGGGPAGATRTRVYLSLDALLDATDLPLGVRDVPALVAGVTSTASTPVTLPSYPPGPYYLIARADDETAVFETIETNNAKARAITIN